MDRVVITRPVIGICRMQVCAESDCTDEEILAVCNSQNPSGTQNGWAGVIRDDKDHPESNPVQCKDDPKRTHFLIDC